MATDRHHIGQQLGCVIDRTRFVFERFFGLVVGVLDVMWTPWDRYRKLLRKPFSSAKAPASHVDRKTR